MRKYRVTKPVPDMIDSFIPYRQRRGRKDFACVFVTQIDHLAGRIGDGIV
ncbi:hypothetical protein SDC9_111272 [bioreactor metagenome]|uniref:Uncharacterized protein n=1 Tax=bioreactor metagenome TaxID=1076179 RepID=A0A645BGT4_9ZZZZ